MRAAVTLLLFLFVAVTSFAQEIVRDTTLNEVIIQAYAAGRPLNEVAASVAHLSSADFSRFNNTSILSSANTIPGVRMEERSPGSYRFSIRGSLIRSPFGVRSVKVYWNGLPFTDAGGNTYLNLLDLNAIGNMEVIKGPGGSLYGAGTGGVILLNSPVISKTQAEVSSTIGSYGLARYTTAMQIHEKSFNVRLAYSHQHANGYRQQSSMTRDVVNADAVVLLSARSTLSATFILPHISYGTPGGLTKAQYDTAAWQARLRGPGPPRGAVEQNAHVVNKTTYQGLSFEHEWTDKISTRLGIFNAYTKFDNPAIRNYEVRREANTGARTDTQIQFGNEKIKGKLTIGGEYQHFSSPDGVYDNNFGEKAAIQTFDNLGAQLGVVFTQLELEFQKGFIATAGLSENFVSYHFQRTQPVTISQNKKFNSILSPRVALLKKITDKLSAFGTVSRGFSPPSFAEVRPSTNTFNALLNAESGTNYELGLRQISSKGFSLDLTAYNFQLDQTIVLRHQSDGAEYFVNAGRTSQKGIEARLTWMPLVQSGLFLSDLKISNSYTYNHYRFKHFASDAEDYSGNQLTGVPPVVNVSTIDATILKKGYANLTATYVDHVPLNDANQFYANEYFLVGGRVGYKLELHQVNIDLFAGIDNALNRKYSLGNDLNAAGFRFYNAAAPRNYYFGLTLKTR
jgi:iron complex outermembrane receptor protein